MGIILIGASPPRYGMSDMLSYHRQWIMLTFSVSSDKVFVVAHGGARALPLIPPLVWCYLSDISGTSAKFEGNKDHHVSV